MESPIWPPHRKQKNGDEIMGMVLLLSCSSSKNCTIIICHFLSRIMQDHERENEKKKLWLSGRWLIAFLLSAVLFTGLREEREIGSMSTLHSVWKTLKKSHFLQHMRAAKLSFLFGFAKSPPIQQLTCQKLAPFWKKKHRLFSSFF